MTKTLEKIKKICEKCQKCPLATTRTNVVFSDGNPHAKIMLIGEAPGQNEDETGLPFVGRAGKLLDKLLNEQDLTREKNIYICNIVKCRPPKNRVPSNAEIKECYEYLEAQIEAIKPKIILLTGATPVKVILKTKEPISKIRGQWFEGPFNSKIMPIFHPSYLLRNPTDKEGSPKWLTIQDLKEVKKKLDSIN